MDIVDSSTRNEPLEPAALKRIRRAIGSRRDLVSSGVAGRQLAAMAAKGDARTPDMVDVAIADPAVVVRLLRIANGSSYGTRDRSDVTGIGRAIALLGQNQLREYATALPLLDKTVPENRRVLVRKELAAMTFASRFAKNLLDTRNPLLSDEGAVTTILARLWSFTCANYAPHEMAALRYVNQVAPTLSDSFQKELFGATTTNLNKEVIDSWSLPKSCYQTIVRAEMRPVPVVAGRDWLPIISGMALRTLEAITLSSSRERESALHRVIDHYRSCIDMDFEDLKTLADETAYEAISLERSLGASPDLQYVSDLLDPYLKEEDNDDSIWGYFNRIDSTGVIGRVRAKYARKEANKQSAERRFVSRSAAGKPDDSLQRVVELTEQVTRFAADYAQAERDGLLSESEQNPKERIEARIIPLVLEGVRDSFGFDRVIWFSRVHDRSYAIRGDTNPAAGEPDGLDVSGLLFAALLNNVQLHIANCRQEKISANLPPWFFEKFPSINSFLMIPVKREDKAWGFVFAERNCTDPDGMKSEESTHLSQISGCLQELFDEFSDWSVEVATTVDKRSAVEGA